MTITVNAYDTNLDKRIGESLVKRGIPTKADITETINTSLLKYDNRDEVKALMSQELSNLRSSWQTDINAGTATTQKLIEGFFASLTKNITDLDNKIERTKQETKENRENLNRNERAIFQQGDANLRITETLNRIEDRLKSTFEQTFVRNHAIDEKLETFTDDIEAINILTARMRADIAKSEDYGARIEARFLAMEQSAMKWKDRAKKVLKYGVVSLLGTGGIGALAGEVIRLLEW